MAYKPRSSTGTAAAASTGYPVAGVPAFEGQAVHLSLVSGTWSAGYATVQRQLEGATGWTNTGDKLALDTDGTQKQSVEIVALVGASYRLFTSSTWVGNAAYTVLTGQRELAV
jgi:hypothetical protein